jgi:hypothetical protein
MALMAFAAVSAAGSLLAAKGQADAASAQSAAAKRIARAKRRQAAELLERAEINVERMREGGVRLVKEQQAAFASGGVALGSGSTLAVMNDAINKTEQGIQDMMADARSKAASLKAGADVDTRLAGQIQEASKFQVAGTLLSGAVSTGRAAGYFS